MNTRKSWRQKMDNPNLPKLVAIPQRMQKRFGIGTMLLPSPHEVDALIRTVPAGSVITISQTRRTPAKEKSRRTGGWSRMMAPWIRGSQAASSGRENACATKVTGLSRAAENQRAAWRLERPASLAPQRKIP
jgi:hypothetical protein